VETLQKLIQENPGNTGFKKKLAASYLNQKAWGKALQTTDEILKTNAKDNETRILKAQILLAQNKSVEAVKELQTKA